MSNFPNNPNNNDTNVVGNYVYRYNGVKWTLDVNNGTQGTTGAQGIVGTAGIVVSGTAPLSPAVNDLWLDIS